MGWWGEQVVPRLVDASLSQRPVAELREQVCAGLHGTVLEVGFGSGLNVPCYPPEVRRVDAVEPSDLAWRRSQRRRAAASARVDRVGLDGERLDAGDASYDGALVTFTLCTIADPGRALAEVRRVLRPGGALHFLEHGAAPEPHVRWWQRRLEPVQRRVAGGCHLTRDPVSLLEQAHLRPSGVGHTYLTPGPGKPWSYLTWGRAVRPAEGA
jgi:SAM-dependent methyltransferase